MTSVILNDHDDVTDNCNNVNDVTKPRSCYINRFEMLTSINNFLKVAQLKQRLTAWMTRVTINSEGLDELP